MYQIGMDGKNIMLNVQKYLIENGLQKLKDEFGVEVREYPEKGIAVFNYSMISSPRFNPIVDECRGLILKIGTWEIVSYPFNRFMNWSEGVQQAQGVPINTQRVSSHQEYETKEFMLSDAIIEMKLDGSIMPLRFENGEWEVSSRSMAYAEGKTNFGITFKQAFLDASRKTNLFVFLNATPSMKDFTIIFELIGPYNRIVTRYSDNEIVLIGARNNKEEFNYRELTVTELDAIADAAKLRRPKYFKANTYEDLLKVISEFPVLDEGVVLKIENNNGSHWRVKVKSASYLAISHMRMNGNISPKNIIHLIIAGEHHEYLGYFPEDKKYFDFVDGIYSEVKRHINELYEEVKGIESQKDFALTMIPKTVYSFEKGILFSMRKGLKLDDLLKEMGGKKLALGLNLKQKFIDEFHIAVEDEDDGK